jgi:hypothetical protein
MSLFLEKPIKKIEAKCFMDATRNEQHWQFNLNNQMLYKYENFYEFDHVESYRKEKLSKYLNLFETAQTGCKNGTFLRSIIEEQFKKLYEKHKYEHIIDIQYQENIYHGTINLSISMEEFKKRMHFGSFKKYK